MSELTDNEANRHYCACLCFNETVSITPSKPIDEEEENLTPGGRAVVNGPPAITHHSIMYAPKCLVLISRLDYIETFRVSKDDGLKIDGLLKKLDFKYFVFGYFVQNCLGTIYTVYIESLAYPLETLIGNILGCIQVRIIYIFLFREILNKIFLSRFHRPVARRCGSRSGPATNKLCSHHCPRRCR